MKARPIGVRTASTMTASGIEGSTPGSLGGKRCEGDQKATHPVNVGVHPRFPASVVGRVARRTRRARGDRRGHPQRARATTLRARCSPRPSGRARDSGSSAPPTIRGSRPGGRLLGVRRQAEPLPLVGRVAARARSQGRAVPRINALVDTYNAVSLRHVIPVGGEDLDQLSGELRLVRADGDELSTATSARGRARSSGATTSASPAGAGTGARATRTRLTDATTGRLLRVRRLPPQHALDAASRS